MMAMICFVDVYVDLLHMEEKTDGGSYAGPSGHVQQAHNESNITEYSI
jgi:hypothetical protein